MQEISPSILKTRGIPAPVCAPTRNDSFFIT